MHGFPDEAEVLGRIVAWAEDEPNIRSVILTSTRARPEGATDDLSDYDVILAVTDVPAFVAHAGWLGAWPEPLARWGDESELLGHRTVFRGVVHGDGTKIDWTIWPQELLGAIAAEKPLPDGLDVGYRVLLDKDGRAAQCPVPTYRAHIPSPPSAGEYREVVEEFWWSATYAAKGLWRGEVVFVKFVLQSDIVLGPVRRVLEWLIEIENDWSVKPGAYGRGLERLSPPDLAVELAATYTGPAVEDNWEALFRTAAFFRKIARCAGDAFGYTYPQEVDDGVTRHLERVRDLPPRARNHREAPPQGRAAPQV